MLICCKRCGREVVWLKCKPGTTYKGKDGWWAHKSTRDNIKHYHLPLISY